MYTIFKTLPSCFAFKHKLVASVASGVEFCRLPLLVVFTHVAIFVCLIRRNRS